MSRIWKIRNVNQCPEHGYTWLVDCISLNCQKWRCSHAAGCHLFSHRLPCIYDRNLRTVLNCCHPVTQWITVSVLGINVLTTYTSSTVGRILWQSVRSAGPSRNLENADVTVLKFTGSCQRGHPAARTFASWLTFRVSSLLNRPFSAEAVRRIHLGSACVVAWCLVSLNDVGRCVCCSDTSSKSLVSRVQLLSQLTKFVHSLLCTFVIFNYYLRFWTKNNNVQVLP